MQLTLLVRYYTLQSQSGCLREVGMGSLDDFERDDPLLKTRVDPLILVGKGYKRLEKDIAVVRHQRENQRTFSLENDAFLLKLLICAMYNVHCLVLFFEAVGLGLSYI